jgi:hypothetical protein
VATQVVELLRRSVPQAEPAKRMDEDQAVLWLLRQRPNWTYDLARKVVRYTIQKS